MVPKVVVKSILGFLISLSLLTLVIKPVAAQENLRDKNIPLLDQQLEQLINSSAPNNQGLSYFVLSSSNDLEQIPADTQNPLTPQKVELGKLLFHETALTINPINVKHWQQGSCASCHLAQAGFRSNLQQALGVGGLGVNNLRHRDDTVPPTEIDKQSILAPSVLNSAYQSVQPWDGRAGSHGPNSSEKLIRTFDINRFDLNGLETLAIDALTTHRMGTSAIAKIPEYQRLFAEAFPDRPYVSSDVEDLNRTGLAIAAYERTLLANDAPFQRWLKGDKLAMTKQEKRGAVKFFSSSCVQCHAGPNLAKTEFHAVGFEDHPSEFSGLTLGRGAITQNSKDDFKFKVPQLYNLTDSSPYGHGGSFKSLREAVEYFNNGKPQNLASLYSGNLSVWFKPLNLTNPEIEDLTAFLETGLRDPNLSRYVPNSLPSKLCFPNNDPESRKQLGCD